MTDLIVRQNEVFYVGSYAEPAFSLWGSGAQIMGGLFGAFRSYNPSLRDITPVGDQTDSADSAVSVTIRPRISFQFKFDRIEGRITNFLEPELDQFQDVLTKGSEWVRKSVGALAFQSHLVTYSSHSDLVGKTSEEVLRKLPSPAIEGIGVSSGNGVIFHFGVPDRSLQYTVTVDHSLAIKGGLFLQMHLFAIADRINYAEVLIEGKSLLDKVLSQLDLHIETES
jgi:hypothetical protein